MFGNLINNRQLKSLVKAKVIEIEPFSKKDLSTVHYTLHANRIKEKLENGEWKTVFNLFESKHSYTLKPGDYVIVEILEKIKLNDENIVGHFIPASNLIEDGLLLIAGKIDKRFGNTGPELNKPPEMINFGLKNLNKNSIQIKPNHRIAHLELFDLRGVSSDKFDLSEKELKLRLTRMLTGIDDGVSYEVDES